MNSFSFLYTSNISVLVKVYEVDSFFIGELQVNDFNTQLVFLDIDSVGSASIMGFQYIIDESYIT